MKQRLWPARKARHHRAFSFWSGEAQRSFHFPFSIRECCYYGTLDMAATAKSKSAGADRAATLAEHLRDALVRERVVPRFVDSYVVDHGRYGLQVHAGLYRDLLTLIQREALLAASACALDLLSRPAAARDERKFEPLKRKDVGTFRQKFLAALARQQQWTMGAALEFQSDLQMYEAILAKAAQERR